MKIECEYKTVNLPGKLRVGVISDSQLSPFSWKNNRTFERNLIKSLQTLKRQECNMIIFAGDICNIANFYAYYRFKNAFKVVFGYEMPLMQIIMGNHDYFPAFTSRWKKRFMFEAYLDKKPYTHYIVNGYHFIGVSPDCRKQRHGYTQVLEWLDEQLADATKDGSDKPVFVTTHNSAINTVYGSDSYGDFELGTVLSKYPQVVNFAGHTHFPMLDERSIHQRDFTSLNTQSTSYVELEKGKANGPVPPNPHLSPMGYVLDFGEDKIDILRINMGTGLEEKEHMRWSLPTVISKDKFVYTDDRFDNSKATEEDYPVMPATYGRSEKIGMRTYLIFEKGQDKDFVHNYKVEFSDGKIQYYFSDFYKGLSNPATEVILPIYSKAAGIYDVEIHAINSRGLESKTATRICDVRVPSYRRYPIVFAPDVKYI